MTGWLVIVFLETIFEKQRLNKKYAFSANDYKDLLNEQISEIL